MTEPGGNPDERHLRNLRAVMQHHAATQPPPSAEPAAKPHWKRKWGPLAPLAGGGAFLLGKLKLLIPLLKLTKLGTLVTMLVSVWAYGLFFGTPFAIGFVLLIFVHEMGHGLVMRHQGLNAGAPVFIPFVGAVIAMKDTPRDAYVEALVGIGGPLLGSLGALVCLMVGWSTGSNFWYALASTGFLLNLFNLIPVSPLDGGRIVGVVSRWLWVVGYAIGIAVFLTTHSPILFLILLLGLFSLGNTFRGQHPAYYDVAPARRRAIAAGYFVLVALLTLGMWAAKEPLQSLHAGKMTAAADNHRTSIMAAGSRPGMLPVGHGAAPRGGVGSSVLIRKV